MKLYYGAAIAMRYTETGITHVSVPIILLATNKYEAVGMFQEYNKREFPDKDGYANRINAVSCLEETAGNQLETIKQHIMNIEAREPL